MIVRVDRARIAALPFFAGLPEQEIDAVADAAEEVEFAAGESLTAEGQFGHGLYFIEEGTADVSTNGTKIGAVEPGDVVGEVAVLASGRRTASVVATSPVRAVSLFKREVWALEDKAPEAARRLRAALDARQDESS
jgi:CRP-like cAMP-binding protein